MCWFLMSTLSIMKQVPRGTMLEQRNGLATCPFNEPVTAAYGNQDLNPRLVLVEKQPDVEILAETTFLIPLC